MNDQALETPDGSRPTAVLYLRVSLTSTAAALAAVTCGNGGWVIWGIRGSRLAIKCV